MAEIEHPPFNFSFHPDIGGTSYDFIKEVGRDRLSFYKRDGQKLFLAQIPHSESFLKVTESNGDNYDFVELLYKYTGELSHARLHFVRYCNKSGFEEEGQPDSDLWRAYWELVDAGEDIILDVNINNKTFLIVHGVDVEDGFDGYSSAEGELASYTKIVQVEPPPGDMYDCPNFVVCLKDNILIIGVQTNSDNYVADFISGFVNPKVLNIRSTPADVKKFFNKVFLEMI